MDLTSALAQVKASVTPFNVLLLVLLIASEIIGTHEKIKASSIYGIVRTLLLTVKDQAWPQNAPPAPAPVAAPASLPAEPAEPTTPNQ